MDDMILKHELKATFAYVDNITVCGMIQAEHDVFMKVARKLNLTVQ
jgi:hypothetical protein